MGPHADRARRPGEGRASSLKRQYGWERTRLDTLEGTRTWTGQGVFTSNLVKIATLTAPPTAP